MEHLESTLTWAKAYIKKGWSLIPLKKDEKIAAIKWDKYQSVRPTLEEVESWFGPGSAYQIAIVCGNVSGGLFVIDFDGEHWKESFENFIHAFPEFAETLIVETGSGKAHLYGVCSEMPSDLTRVSSNHVELRANGHYVVAPPSIHPVSGNPYKWDRYTPAIKLSPERLNEVKTYLKPVEEKACQR